MVDGEVGDAVAAGGAGSAPVPAGDHLAQTVVAVLDPVLAGSVVADLRVARVGEGLVEMFGRKARGRGVATEVVGRLLSEVLPATTADGWMQLLCEVARGGEPAVMTRPPLPGDTGRGRRFLVERRDGAVVVCVRPMTRAEQSSEALEHEGPRWRRAFAEAPVGLAVATWDGRILDVNEAACVLFGRSREDVVGHAFNDFAHREDRHRRLDRATLERTGRVEMRKRFLAPDGQTIWVRQVLAAIEEAGERRLLSVLEDVGDTVRAQAELNRLAFTDPLTGLANRAALRREVARSLRRWSAGQAPVPTLLALDVDRFRVVNDSLGHDVGDRLLRCVAQELTEAVGAEGVVARVGADEFAVLVHEPERAEPVCRAVHAAVGSLVLAGHELSLTLSTGHAAAEPGSDDGSLLRDAETALHEAKRTGGRRCVSLDAALRARALSRLDVEAALRRGLERGELRPFYQPITTLEGRWKGVEALVRWHHPEHGVLPPAAFLDVAEESGLVVPLGQHVMREACVDAARWRRLRPGFTTAVNIAARHLLSGHLVEDVVAALDAAALPATALTVEVTETALLVADDVATAALEALRAMGCSVALDDFGTGYSSLTHLRDLPADVLKVDRSFVASAPTDPGVARLLRGICSLGRDLDLAVVAEGVEDEPVRDAAVSAGAQLLQGYLFGRPAPAAAVDAHLGAEGSAKGSAEVAAAAAPGARPVARAVAATPATA